MKKKYFALTSIMIMAIFLNGCLVTQSKYIKKAEEADKLAQELALEREKNQALTEQNLALKESTTKLAQKAEQTSSTYQQLLKEMKAEIDEGQITIKELKGKLTMDVVDKILFDSGEARIKEDGLKVLQRVVDILQPVKDKNILIEGHTDNVPIVGRLAQRYPTNWELSHARAINVTRYLQEKGIDPRILSATAYGEYQPIADNSTPEGRAKNRRIAIILLPKD
jgi:chemotaxis protein MotB